jgi:hypothetical protein
VNYLAYGKLGFESLARSDPVLLSKIRPFNQRAERGSQSDFVAHRHE